jgi:hypothetical protein
VRKPRWRESSGWSRRRKDPILARKPWPTELLAFLFYFAAGTGLITFTVWTLLGDIDEAVTRAVTVLVAHTPLDWLSRW